MGKSNSMFGGLANVAIVAALGWAAWYGYSHWISASSGPPDSEREAEYNCRQAFAKLTEDYACRDAESCDMTTDEVSAMKDLEAAIEQHCN